MSYPFGKGKKSALKLLQIDIPGLDQVLGQPGAIHAPGDSIDILLTPLRTEGMYNNEDATVEGRGPT